MAFMAIAEEGPREIKFSGGIGATADGSSARGYLYKDPEAKRAGGYIRLEYNAAQNKITALDTVPPLDDSAVRNASPYEARAFAGQALNDLQKHPNLLQKIQWTALWQTAPYTKEVEGEEGKWDLVSHMGGVVKKVAVHPGDVVEALDPAFTVEIMKMEFGFRPMRDGVVESVSVRRNQRVKQGTPLARFTPKPQNQPGK